MQHDVDKPPQKRTIVLMNVVADTNTFIAVALNEPEKELIIRLTEGYDLAAPDVLPFEVGNARRCSQRRTKRATLPIPIGGKVRDNS